MRSGKIITWLFTLAQFILFIKLVEYVQGEEVKGGDINTTVANFENLPATTTTILPPIGRQGRARLAISKGSQTRKFKMPNNQNQGAATGKEVQSKTESGRACPACEAGGCNTNVVQAEFPLLQLKTAAVAIFIWYLIFLKVWKYPLVKKAKKPQQGYAPSVQPYGGYSSGGYSGGYSGGSSNYEAPSPPAYGDNDSDSDSSGFGGILDSIWSAVEKFAS